MPQDSIDLSMNNRLVTTMRTGLGAERSLAATLVAGPRLTRIVERLCVLVIHDRQCAWHPLQPLEQPKDDED